VAAAKKGALRRCAKGHEYYKSSDCPTCPKCESARVPPAGFLATLSAPARRALEREKILSLGELSKWSERELLTLHGIGPSSIPKLRAALARKSLTLKQQQ
jgi:hypothetical protein